MLRPVLLTALVVTCVVGRPNRMEGQDQAGPKEYDASALRLESRWGNHLLVRGREGTFIGKIGGFRAPDLTTTVAPSPEALREAQEFRQRYNRGNTVLAVGALVLGVGAGVARLDDADRNVLIPAYTAVAAGTFLIGYAALQLNKAYSALARSIWWYNRDLGR